MIDRRLADISFLDLQILSELSAYRSLRALSRSMNIEAPTLSKKLKNIQAELGIEVIRTSATGYALTPDGTHINLKAKEFLSSSVDFIPSKNSLLRQRTVYTVGSRGFLNIFLCGSFVSALPAINSGPLLRFIDLSPDELRLTVFEGVLDLAVSLEQFNWPKNWVITEIGQLTWSFYVRENHPLKERSTRAELIKYPWTRSAYWNGRSIAQGSDSLSVPRIDRIAGHEIQTASVAIELIKNSDDVALIPEIVANEQVRMGLIRKIICPEIEMPSATITFGINSDRVNQKLYASWSKALVQKFRSY